MNYEQEYNRLRNNIANAQQLLIGAIGDLVPDMGLTTVEEWRERAVEVLNNLDAPLPEKCTALKETGITQSTPPYPPPPR